MKRSTVLPYLGALVATNIKATFALRASFWMQAAFMILNNVAFLIFWALFFTAYEHRVAWRLGDVALLFGVSAGGFGLAGIFAGGYLDLSRPIVQGDLDVHLARPRGVLLPMLASHSRASCWGDIASGIVLFAISGAVTPDRAALLLCGWIIGAVVFVSFGVILHSLSFFIGSMETLGRQGIDFLITFSVYPEKIFGLGAKTVFYTVIPAALVSHLPVRYIREFDALSLGASLGGAAILALVALAVFRLGLRRYTSGNQVTSGLGV